MEWDYTNPETNLGNGMYGPKPYKTPNNTKYPVSGIASGVGGLVGLGLGLAEGYGKIDQYKRTSKALDKQGLEMVGLGKNILNQSINTGSSLTSQNINNYAMAGKEKEGFYQSLQPQILGAMNQGISQGRGLVSEGKNLQQEAKKYKLSEWEKWNMVLGGGLKGGAGGVNTAMSVLGLFA